MSELWDVRRTAEWAKSSNEAIYRMVAEGRIPFLRIGRLLRFDPLELEKWAIRNGGGRDERAS